jgi:hypothetical protein
MGRAGRGKQEPKPITYDFSCYVHYGIATNEIGNDPKENERGKIEDVISYFLR